MSDLESWQEYQNKCRKIVKNKKVIFEREESKYFLEQIKKNLKNRSYIKPQERAIEYDFEIEKDKTLGIDPSSDRKLKKGQIDIDSKIDLHGFTIDEAYRKVKSAFERAEKNYHRCMLIVTGKGLHSENSEKTIRNSVYQWLKEPYFSSKIIKYIDAPKQLGGDGAIYVLLKKQNI